VSCCSSSKIDADEDVDDDTAEGTDPPNQGRNGGGRRTTLADQYGDRRIRDGDSTER